MLEFNLVCFMCMFLVCFVCFMCFVCVHIQIHDLNYVMLLLRNVYKVGKSVGYTTDRRSTTLIILIIKSHYKNIGLVEIIVTSIHKAY